MPKWRAPVAWVFGRDTVHQGARALALYSYMRFLRWLFVDRCRVEANLLDEGTDTHEVSIALLQKHRYLTGADADNWVMYNTDKTIKELAWEVFEAYKGGHTSFTMECRRHVLYIPDMGAFLLGIDLSRREVELYRNGENGEWTVDTVSAEYITSRMGIGWEALQRAFALPFVLTCRPDDMRKAINRYLRNGKVISIELQAASLKSYGLEYSVNMIVGGYGGIGIPFNISYEKYEFLKGFCIGTTEGLLSLERLLGGKDYYLYYSPVRRAALAIIESSSGEERMIPVKALMRSGVVRIVWDKHWLVLRGVYREGLTPLPKQQIIWHEVPKDVVRSILSEVEETRGRNPKST